MNLFYSPSTNSFYDSTIHEVMPKDVVSITKEEHPVLNGKANGKKIVPGPNKKPIVVDLDPPTQDQSNEIIKSQIKTLESNQTRALREFALTGDKTRLAALDKEIVELRLKLK